MMLSYHNDENLKALVISEMKKHQEQDQFVKGMYGHKDEGIFKGCAVGCAIDSVNTVLGKSYSTFSHKVLEEAIGVPEWLALLQDLLFENLPDDESSQFAVDFLQAIPVGINLEPVKWKFCAFLLHECIDRVTSLQDISHELKTQVIDAMQGSLDVYEAAIRTGTLDEEAAWSAKMAAVAAGAKADAVRFPWTEEAGEAIEVAAVRAAWAAAASWSTETASWAAEVAVRVVWSAEATESWTMTIRESAYKRQAVELIRLLKGVN